MTDGEDLELQIMLGIVRIIEHRRDPKQGSRTTLTEILQNLPPGVSVGTIVGAIIEPEGMQMGDTYNTGQAVNVGPGGTVSGGTVNQWWSNNHTTIDLAALADELAQLRAEVRQRDAAGDHDEALGALAVAERAAKEGDGPGALQSLRNAGRWVLDVAKQVGIPVATKALEAALNLGS